MEEWFHDLGVRVNEVLSNALEADQWNQLEEAVSSYTRSVLFSMRHPFLLSSSFSQMCVCLVECGVELCP
jgi:hypothetical protein